MRVSQLLFPGAPQVRVHDIVRTGSGLVIFASTRGAARCPHCRHRSKRVHSHYERHLSDVACGGCAVTVALRVRRLRCATPGCRIFGERLHHVVIPHVHRTARATGLIVEEGFALGGRPGARAAKRLGLQVSKSTVLRVLRAQPLPPAELVRVLGVDDFAFRKGRRYGTILVNLELHQVIDLLPDRTAATLAAWLRAHPEVRIVSRDRAGAYAEGARDGAPQAQQIADRFHLTKNVTEALGRYLARHVRVLRQANEVSSPPADQPPADRPSATASQRTQQRRQERRDYRLARYEQVHALRAQGASLVTIAQQTGIARRTVQRFLNASSFPERRPRLRRAPSIAPYLPYLRERWAAGCHNAFRLWQEVCTQGFAGSYGVVADCLRAWRHHPADAPPAATTLVLSDDPSPRQVCWLLLRPMDKLTEAERTYLSRLYQVFPKVAVAESLVEEFATILREKDVSGWYAWLHGLEISGIPELQAVAHSMWQDRAAIEAAVQQEWSNGQVEGAVNRLKTTKRTMYGRANFDLLKLRVLHAA
jgi:transposase